MFKKRRKKKSLPMFETSGSFLGSASSSFWLDSCIESGAHQGQQPSNWFMVHLERNTFPSQWAGTYFKATHITQQFMPDTNSPATDRPTWNSSNRKKCRKRPYLFKWAPSPTHPFYSHRPSPLVPQGRWS